MTNAIRIDRGRLDILEEQLTEEAPLQIKVNGVPFTVTMRSPGQDEFLALGLLCGEGILSSSGSYEIKTTRHPETGTVVCLNVLVGEDAVLKRFEGVRQMASMSSCGLCGKRELSDLEGDEKALERDEKASLSISSIAPMMEAMRHHQAAFEATGGSHAAGLFTVDGKLLCVFEDIGRHNAVDKVLGWMVREQRRGENFVLAVSGRVSFEIVTKAWWGRIPFLMAVSAPSTLAIETAQQAGMTLLGFCRDTRATVYTGSEFITEVQSSSMEEASS